MLQAKKIIGRYLRFPLMWVMLLWAFTMPGQEVEVYRFLFKSTVEKTNDNLSATELEGKVAINKKAPQAFLDAKESNPVKVNLQQNLNCPLLYFALAILIKEGVSICAPNPSIANPLAQLLPVIIQPNAP